MGKLLDEEKVLKSDIKLMRKRMDGLNLKAKNLDRKLEEMERVLTIDMSEKEYIYNIKQKIDNDKAGIKEVIKN
jgi:hypothetical protein